MQLSAPDVRIVAVETCDFSTLPSYSTPEVLRAALPGGWQRYLNSATSRRMIAELGVQRRYLTHVPGTAPIPKRLNALDLARSAVERLRATHSRQVERLDALIFVSASNPNPCNSQAALLAERSGINASCMDLKAGCSGGVLGLVQAALLIKAGCERVLVVMAENLSQFTPADDLRMLLTVGDGAACVLLERHEGPGFLTMVHGSRPEFAGAMQVRTAFPPASSDARYVYEFAQSHAAREFIHAQWRSLFYTSLAAASMDAADLDHCFFHQTHAGHVNEMVADLGVPCEHALNIVSTHGNMGPPTFAVAMAKRFAALRPGHKYLLEAVGGGVSWCAIVAEHQ
jgi:3-oxoacyl-[acyl-carrier-protein] synthase-3